MKISQQDLTDMIIGTGLGRELLDDGPESVKIGLEKAYAYFAKLQNNEG